MTARGRLGGAAAALLVSVTLTALVTWPQALHLATRVASHDDPLFSIWRLAWIAHALETGPTRMFDGNIFHPARRTLTFSDAMMLEGALGAPLLWAGASPVLVYNLLLFAGFAASGLAMFVLARYLLDRTGPALVAAAIFTVAPYRIEHFMHLELQWAMWVPLTLWAIHRTVDTGSWRFGLLAGIFLWLQMLSSVYYGAFLGIAAAVLAGLLLATRRQMVVRAAPALLGGAALAALMALPYALPYLETARSVGIRESEEVARYSATPWSYLASPPQSRLWGWTAGWGGPELKLFPGAVAAILSVMAIALRPGRIVLVYAALALITIELSLGLNGYTYSFLFDRVGALHGFRSPSRFGVIACCAIAMLAGFGAKALADRAAPRRMVSAPLWAALLVLVAIDGSTGGMVLTDLEYEPPDTFNVYKTIRALGPGAILELPIARLDELPGREATYVFWSTAHWHPLANGYSGFFPEEFKQTAARMERFPDDRALAHLRNIGVRYIVVHRTFYGAREHESILARIAERPELHPVGTFPDPVGEARLFVLSE